MVLDACVQSLRVSDGSGAHSASAHLQLTARDAAILSKYGFGASLLGLHMNADSYSTATGNKSAMHNRGSVPAWLQVSARVRAEDYVCAGVRL